MDGVDTKSRLRAHARKRPVPHAGQPPPEVVQHLVAGSHAKGNHGSGRYVRDGSPDHMQTLTINQNAGRGFGALLSSAAQQASVTAVSLSGDCETARNHRFYLASIAKDAWIPRVVTITQDGSTLGVVYAKERKIAGIATGLFYADATLDAMVVARPENRERVFEDAVRQLVNRRGFRGLRILAPPKGYEDSAIERILASVRLDVRRTRIENHSVLELASSYELFLAGLGQRTRRNFRYYRRRFESAGAYVPAVSLAEFQSVAMRMLKQPVVGAQPSRVDRALRMLSAAGRPILVGLRRHDGEFLSIVGGWYELDRAVVIFQMNNEREHPQSSLSLVARGYLIEALIAPGVRRLLFWAGAGAPLDRYCHFLPTTRIHLDAPGWVWRTLRGAAARASVFLPRRLAGFASWIEPGVMQTEDSEIG